MIKIIGIGNAGCKILNYLENQNFHILKEKEIKFLTVRNHDEYRALEYNEKDILYSISGLGGETGTKFTRLLNKEAKNLKVNLKSILILPFSHEGKGMGVTGFLQKQITINQNIEIFSNDDLAVPENRELDENEMLRMYDKEVFEIINTKTPVLNNSFIIEQTSGKTKYKALIYFSAKHYRIFLILPKFKLIDYKSMGDDIPSNFGIIIDKKQSIANLTDIKDIAQKSLDKYINKTR